MFRILGILFGLIALIMLLLIILGKIELYNVFIMLIIVAFCMVFLFFDWKIRDEKKAKNLSPEALEYLRLEREKQFDEYFERKDNNQTVLLLAGLITIAIAFIIYGLTSI